MKIEIDFSKPEELRKMKRELEMALSTIDGALVAIGKAAIDPNQQPLPKIQTENIEKPLDFKSDIAQSGSSISHLFVALPKEFTASDVFRLAETDGVPRSKVRKAIADLIEADWLEEIERGVGRRPSKFRKT